MKSHPNVCDPSGGKGSGSSAASAVACGGQYPAGCSRRRVVRSPRAASLRGELSAVFLRQLGRSLGAVWDDGRVAPLVERLARIGVVDPVRCRALAVRGMVAERVDGGRSKCAAMWDVAEQLECSYEYVRKCVYDCRLAGGEGVC